MNKCHICGSNEIKEELVKETFEIDGKLVMVEGIPAQVCQRCGEVIFSSEIAENIRLIVHSNSQPTKSIQVDVFAFSA
ncbi:YgiT-type zinc finger protein [Cyanobacterium aponinum UTEX 3222]|uniref:YgiT-type zinc finger protein n=1 Tax=Cyanobacterium aponinum 0216 TaxID=2676140 RepID=A0A844GRY5_9CHRO|nr:YgiT-type zinc finger protein [Cyanobacterium aponinum]MBD2393004.1 YgiT-type zinc finger protein [Cyanobacterium aponinum FACHB-4101]MTF37822.1 YgiT-type zinc finger protein [Cyanobacterium aponinum 0216]WRL38886.1 YgiT-type zinc finger protein [Cyanobacterium aponinum UTEX 3221]WRL40803.1 YgiT-type zinc finger protein [Cyanobacterium aponinum UTEX 3222]